MINWEQFKFHDYKINSKTNLPYYQEYLQPCYYVELFLEFTEEKYLLDLYQKVIDQLGALFQFHHHNKTSQESKIRNKEEAFARFPEFLENKRKNYLWFYLSNMAGTGTNTTPGGIGNASFEC